MRIRNPYKNPKSKPEQILPCMIQQQKENPNKCNPKAYLMREFRERVSETGEEERAIRE